MNLKRASEIEHKLPLGKSDSDYPYSKSDKIFTTDQLFLYSEQVSPGRNASAPHFHRSIDEIIYMVRGELVAHEGEDKVTIKAGDSICFKANTGKKHYLQNTSNKIAEFLLFRQNLKDEDIIY